MNVAIQPPDSHHLSAAVGWLELGNPAEALAELNQIGSAARKHPHVLEIEWSIYAKLNKWEECVSLAKELTLIARKNPFGWLHLSFALHELKRTREAYDNLLPVLELFPTDWLMRYNLACYATQLGNLDEAERWLAGSMLLGDRKKIKKMAAEDPDLAPLFRK